MIIYARYSLGYAYEYILDLKVEDLYIQSYNVAKIAILSYFGLFWPIFGQNSDFYNTVAYYIQILNASVQYILICISQTILYIYYYGQILSKQKVCFLQYIYIFAL